MTNRTPPFLVSLGNRFRWFGREQRVPFRYARATMCFFNSKPVKIKRAVAAGGIRILLLLALVWNRPALLAAAPAKVKFNRDVRPILSDKCFFCHGPDPKKREADLRLDVRDAAVEAKAFLPGKAEMSEVIQRILTTDADDHMPPAKSKLGDLTPGEIAIL